MPGWEYIQGHIIGALRAALYGLLCILLWAGIFWAGGAGAIQEPLPGILYWPGADPLAVELNSFLVKLVIAGGITGLIIGVVTVIVAVRSEYYFVSVPFIMVPSCMVAGLIVGVLLIPLLAPDEAVMRPLGMRILLMGVWGILGAIATYHILMLPSTNSGSWSIDDCLGFMFFHFDWPLLTMLSVLTMMVWAIAFWFVGVLSIATPKVDSMYWPSTDLLGKQMNGYLVKLVLLSGAIGVLIVMIEASIMRLASHFHSFFICRLRYGSLALLILTFLLATAGGVIISTRLIPWLAPGEATVHHELPRGIIGGIAGIVAGIYAHRELRKMRYF